MTENSFSSHRTQNITGKKKVFHTDFETWQTEIKHINLDLIQTWKYDRRGTHWSFIQTRVYIWLKRNTLVFQTDSGNNAGGKLGSWCLESSQPLWILSGLSPDKEKKPTTYDHNSPFYQSIQQQQTDSRLEHFTDNQAGLYRVSLWTGFLVKSQC